MTELPLAIWLLFVPPTDGLGGLFPIEEHIDQRRCEDHAAWLNRKGVDAWCGAGPYAGTIIAD
jgi:hypothetical protein